MHDAVAIAFQGLAAAAGLMTVVWLVSLPRRDASIIDIFWGLAFALLAWIYYYSAGPQAGLRSILVPVLVTVWALRLSGYIWWRNRGGGEDYRYAAMRKKYGRAFPLASLVIVFWLQAALAWLIGMPLLQVQRLADPPALGWLDAVGLLLFAVGLFFEAVGDWQLARFKADPANKGRVMDRGLWRYTRHPNYFGDACLWWGLTAFALATPGSLWVLPSPVLMTFLLLRVSGVALLEKGLGKTKPGYEEYVRRTSAFFPLPPKSAR
jgi:steroid 5-alpha reductase family enzyme